MKRQRHTARYPNLGIVPMSASIFLMVEVGDWVVPALDIGGRIVVLDQRAIVTDESGRVVYSPRRYMDVLDPNMAIWLRQHPEWDALMEVGKRT